MQVSDSTYLKGVVTENKKYDFCMCNPPFFNIDHSTNRRRSDSDNSTNDQPPAGSTNEISSVGGEIEFIKRIMRDSSILRDQIRYENFFDHPLYILQSKYCLNDNFSVQNFYYYGRS